MELWPPLTCPASGGQEEEEMSRIMKLAWLATFRNRDRIRRPFSIARHGFRIVAIVPSTEIAKWNVCAEYELPEY